MKRIISFIFLFTITLLFSCSEEVKPKNEPAAIVIPFGDAKKTELGITGYTIDLPSTHKIAERKDSNFVVYYITSTNQNYKGEAGIYFGPTPDGRGPENIVSKEESPGMALGKNSKTVKYTTTAYTWIETVIEESDSTKIQTWYYAYNEVELNNLRDMINTLIKK